MGLYVEDKNKIKFTTRIKSIVENKNGNFLILDQSFFNPEHFPLPSDSGYINGENVLRVVVEKGIVMHLVDSDSRFTINMMVSCEIDLKNRLDYMVQDTAFHLLSFIISKKFNVGISLLSVDDMESIIYIDKNLKEEEVFRIESSCNEYIKKDLKIEEKTELNNNLLKQYIKIGESEYEMCPYVHIDSLKQIQIIKIKRFEDFNGGTKISFLSGERVFKYLRERDLVVNSLENECNTSLDQIAFKVRLLKEESDISTKKYEVLLEDASSYIAESFKKDFIIEKTTWNENLIKSVGKILSQDHKIIAFYNEDTFKSFIFVNKNTDIKDIVDTLESKKLSTNYPRKVLENRYGEISFENSLSLKRFISDIYDKILKYSEYKKGD